MLDDSAPNSTERRIKKEKITEFLSLVRQLCFQLVTCFLSELLHSLALVVQGLASCVSNEVDSECLHYTLHNTDTQINFTLYTTVYTTVIVNCTLKCN